MTLGHDATLEGVWEKGLQSYSAQHWEECIERINKAQELFQEYQNATMHCLRSCRDTGNADALLTDVICSLTALLVGGVLLSNHLFGTCHCTLREGLVLGYEKYQTTSFFHV